MQDWLLVIVTVVLVLITGFYAWQTRHTVVEMRAARLQSVMPHVRPAYEHYGGGVGFPRIVNVGPGVAIDTDVTLTFEPGAALKRRWRAPILASGEFRELVIRRGGGVLSAQDVVADYESVRIVGSCRDALGDLHQIDAIFDIREWWQMAVESGERLVRGKRPELVIALEKIEAALRRQPWTGSV